jgi:hypothetical protein
MAFQTPRQGSKSVEDQGEGDENMRRSIVFFLSFCSFIFFIANPVFAIKDGLLDGKSPVSVLNVTNVQTLTDGRVDGTAASFQAGGEVTFVLDHVYHITDVANSINESDASKLQYIFFDENDNVVFSMNAFRGSFISSWRPVSIKNVKTIKIVANKFAFSWMFDVKGVLASSEDIPQAEVARLAGVSETTRINLNWEQPLGQNLSNVLVYRNGELIKTLDANTTSYQDEGLKSETTYRYTVKTLNVDGAISQGVSIDVKTKAYTFGEPGLLRFKLPEEVQNVRIPERLTDDSSGSTYADKDAKATWNLNGVYDISEVLLYGRYPSELSLQLYSDSGDLLATYGPSTESWRSVDVKGVKSVVFVCPCVSSTIVNEIDVRGKIAVNEPGISVSLANVTDKSVELAIEAEYTDEMFVYRNGEKIANLPGDATSYLDTGLEATTDYTYWVDAKNDVGTTRSDTVTVTTKRPDTSLDLGGVSVGNVTDLWRTIVSLAANYWQFVLVGIAFGLAEWLFRLPGKGVKALKIKGKETKT